MRLLVVGGSGFVGTRVVRSALARGAQVASLTRNGAPAAGADSSFDGVEWLQGDAVEGGSALQEKMSGFDAVVSCLGAFGSNEAMLKINGTANASLARVASEVGVRKFAYVSAAKIGPVVKAMTAAGYEGYFAGKMAAEEAVAEHFGPNGAILRPGPIYGTRVVSPTLSIPLGAIGVPLTTVLETTPVRALASSLPFALGDLVMPWVSVEDVADACVAHALATPLEAADGAAVVLDWAAIRDAARDFRQG